LSLYLSTAPRSGQVTPWGSGDPEGNDHSATAVRPGAALRVDPGVVAAELGDLSREPGELTEEMLVPVHAYGGRESLTLAPPHDFLGSLNPMCELGRGWLPFHWWGRALVNSVPTSGDDQGVRMVRAQVVERGVGIREVDEPDLTARVAKGKRGRSWPPAARPGAGTQLGGHTLLVSVIQERLEHGQAQALDLSPSGREDRRMRKRRHDRHGRVARANNDRRRRPSDGFRTAHGARFTDLVGDALAELPGSLAEAVAEIDVSVEDVPAIDEGRTPEDGVPLARITDWAGSRRLVVYRRPLELRATTRAELIDVTSRAIAEEVARHLGLDIEDLFDDE